VFSVVVQFVFFASLPIPLRALRLRAFKAFDRKGRKEISAKFAKKNDLRQCWNNVRN
jgi:hypothetical protein